MSSAITFLVYFWLTEKIMANRHIDQRTLRIFDAYFGLDLGYNILTTFRKSCMSLWNDVVYLIPFCKDSCVLIDNEHSDLDIYAMDKCFVDTLSANDLNINNCSNIAIVYESTAREYSLLHRLPFEKLIQSSRLVSYRPVLWNDARRTINSSQLSFISQILISLCIMLTIFKEHYWISLENEIQ